MKENSYYTGIDWARLAAAVLVIANHTSPLGSINSTADFLLTQCIARMAVPFFFMTTGYFTLSRYHRDDEKLRSFLKKTGIIYAAAVLFYLPLNLYNGYFSDPRLLSKLLKDLIFDGTVYHLWYLPASMLGMVIAWRLVEKLDYKKGLAAAAALYLIGIFGDSYYGVVAGLPGIHGFYDMLFWLFDDTRNGVFMAPIFLMLGGYIAEQNKRLTKMQAFGGFVVSAAMMLLEAMLTDRWGTARHTGMYFFLVPCMVFVFQMLLCFRGRKIWGLRTAALLIYLVHPMVIVAVRAAAKLTRLQGLLVENSLVHFAAVCILSFLIGFSGAVLWERRTVKQKHITATERAFIELDMDSLSHNAAVLRSAMPQGCELMAVVKANAYGHGDYEIATQLEKDGIKSFAVATVDEGLRLRRYGIRGTILILGYTDVHRAWELKSHRLTQTVIDYSYACLLQEQGVPLHVHIAVDSGMHRLGLAVEDTEGVRCILQMKNLQVDGIFTHLCCCDSLLPEDIAYTRGQIARFYGLIDRLKEQGITVPPLHLQSSYGLLNYPDLRCDYVRVGISLYGVGSMPQEKTALQPALRPVLSLKARVVLIKDVPKGEYIGYGRAHKVWRDSRIAILPLGYGDGLPRSLSNGKAYVRIGERMAPIIGRICMDQLTVDITEAGEVAVGDIATVIGDGDSRLSAPYIAASAGSISNELFSRMGARLPIVTKE